MNKSSFDINEFISKETTDNDDENFNEEVAEVQEIDIQKAVVEELATEKIELHEELKSKEKIIVDLNDSISKLKKENEEIKSEIQKLQKEIEEYSNKLEEEKKEKSEISLKLTEFLTSENEDKIAKSSEIALLDRYINLNDRFPGETRDHVLEVIREARDNAEKEGRIRRAQILEGVLVENEPNGNLLEKRQKLEKLFAENGNILSGKVIQELEKMKISHKNGEEYLLPSEIIKRYY